jgi:hypothetical protein
MAGILSVILTDLAFTPLAGQDGPILSELDGDIVLTTIDQFPAHKITLSAADMRAVKTIDPTILPCGCQIRDEQVGGIVAEGYIFDPSAQITNDGHIISLAIPNRTEGLRLDAIGPGWVAATGIDAIAKRLATHSPPWTAAVVDTGPLVVTTKPVFWQGNDPNFSNADLNTISKNDGVLAGWNVGAATTDALLSGDGGITSVAFGCNTRRMFGLTNNFNTYDYHMLTHAIFLDTDGLNTPTSGILRVFESGVAKFSSAAGAYAPGDVLQVMIVNGVVQYLVNNVVFYNSSVPPAYPALGGCSIYDANAVILGAAFTKYVAPKDIYYAVAFPDNTSVLDAETQLANKTFRHIRQKWDGSGVPLPALELGLFNAPPKMVLKTSDGESPSQVRARNPNLRLLGPQIDYQWTTSQIITIGVAAGGGTGDTQVKLRNLYDYLHPVYPAPTPRNNVFTGQPYFAAFPEYLATDFPIERRVSLNGTYYYVVKNVAAIAKMKAKGHWSGELWGDISDSSIVYVDSSPDAQRMAVERALYVECMTKLKQHAEQHFTATLQTDGRGRVTQAGDQVNVQIQRVGRGRSALTVKSFMETDINVNPMVMEVTRKYRDSDITDDWKVSTLGRLLTNDAQALHQSMTQMEAVRLIPDVKDATFVVGPIEQTINSVFPLDIPVRLPNTMYQMTSASLKVEIKPARHNVRLGNFSQAGTTLDGAHGHSLTIPPLTVGITNLPFHQHTGYAATHNHGGITTTLVTTGSTGIGHGHGFAKGSHSHKITGTTFYFDNNNSAFTVSTGAFGKNGETVVTGWKANHVLWGDHTHGEEAAAVWATDPSVNDLGATSRDLGSGATGLSYTTDTVQDYNLGHATAGDNANYQGNQLIGMTTEQLLGTRTDDPLHTGAHDHNLNADVVETNLGGLIHIYINSGDGVYVDRTPELGGPWSSSFEILGNVFVNSDGVQVSGTGMERFLQAPGRVVGIRVAAVNSASNITGICNVQVSGTWELTKGALTSTIFAQ